MEYVIVKFPESRIVIIDGEESGRTNKSLCIEQGTHVFKLADPKDYKPRRCTRIIKETTVAKPMEIFFEKK